VNAAYSGEQAVAVAKLWKPDVLISDVPLCGITGVASAVQILRDCPECQVILFSDQAAPVDLNKDWEIQEHHFQILNKPIHPQALIDCVATLVDRRRKFADLTSHNYAPGQ